MKKIQRILAVKLASMKVSMALVAALSLASSQARGAGHEIVIIGAPVEKTPVALLGFTRSAKPDNSALTRTLSETLRFDLDHSGFFVTVLDRNNAELLVKADYTLSGNELTAECYVYDMPGGKFLFGRRRIGKASAARREVHRLADVIVKNITGLNGIASTRIVFVAGGGRKYKNIFLVDYDGKNLVQTTRDKTFSLTPDWSPDGKRVYYTSYLYSYPRVCAIELSTRKRWVVCGYPGLNAFAAISPRGKEMALTLSKDGCVEIYSASLGGKRPRRLTRSRGGVAASPCWSPSGTQIAFVSNRGGGAHIYAMNADGSNVRRLLSGFSYVTSLDWSPTGNDIAFSARRGGTLQLFVLDIKSRKVRQVTFDPASHENPSFAPNGIHIVYVATKRYKSDLYIVDTRDPEPYRLTSLEGNETYPAWSPVGF